MIENQAIEHFVSQAACNNSREVNDQLYHALKGREIFYRVKLGTVTNKESGQSEERAISCPLLTLPSGQHAFVTYTSKENDKLVAPFGGATWEHALEILVKMPQADGMILINNTADSVAISKEFASKLLEELGIGSAEAHSFVTRKRTL